MKKTVLITGAGGLIGTILRNGLADTYTLRATSLQPIPGVESLTADISDQQALLAACQGVDSIIHLAALGSPQESWENILPTNIVGTYNVFEAAAKAGVKQVIFASSNHAVGNYDLQNSPAIYHTGLPLLDHKVPVRPDSFYGLSKCFGEAAGRLYADNYGLRVICLRIGYINREDSPFQSYPGESRERLTALWLSHRDMLQLIEKCLQAEQVQFAIVYGISNNRPHFYDLAYAREIIGYIPQDGADVSLARTQHPQQD